MPKSHPYLKPIYFRPSAKVQELRPGGETEAERKRFYGGRAWRRLRAAFLAENPLCADCLAAGKLTEATIPHHIEERLKAPELAYVKENLLALCSPCHTKRHKHKKG